MAARAIERSGLGRLLRQTKTWRGLLVLNYHRLARQAADVLDQGVWSSTPEQFDEQVAFLEQQGDLIDPADLTADLVSPAARSRNIMLTFDDGYRDNYTLALPVLEAHGARAVFFVVTGVLDSPRLLWWDEVAWMVRGCRTDSLSFQQHTWPVGGPERRERTIERLLRRYKKLPTAETEAFLDTLGEATGTGRPPDELGRDLWLTWDLVRELRDAGMTIGGHTVSHPLLARCSAERQAEELAGCAARLQQELGAAMEWFSYPVGGQSAFSQGVVSQVEALGVRWACSQYGGFQRPGELSPLNVKRVPVERWMAGPQFQSLVAMPNVFA